jgi:hypothetical protein
MLQGYKTYITIVVMALFNILEQLGLTDVTSESVEAAVNTILAILAFIFNYVGRKRLEGGVK